MKDPLEILEYMQLSELVNAGVVKDSAWLERLAYLSTKYSKEDLDSISLKFSKNKFCDDTGFLKKQRCTNKNCSHSFISEDISETCDICYHPTLRIIG